MQQNPPSSPHIDCKIVILGGGGVGKSSFVCRYTQNTFSDTISTLGAAFSLKKWGHYHFAIWDNAGQDKFAKISSHYCRGADAAIIAYDLTDLNSFNFIPQHLEQYRKAESKGLVVLIGTKLDLVQENPEMRQVSTEQAKEYAASIGAVFFETSARTNINVETVFNYIGSALFPGSPTVVNVEPEPSCPRASNSTQRRNDANREACCCVQ